MCVRWNSLPASKDATKSMSSKQETAADAVPSSKVNDCMTEAWPPRTSGRMSKYRTQLEYRNSSSPLLLSLHRKEKMESSEENESAFRVLSVSTSTIRWVQPWSFCPYSINLQAGLRQHFRSSFSSSCPILPLLWYDIISASSSARPG